MQAILALLITILTIAAVVAIFFVVIDRISKDAAMTKIAKIALGVVGVILLLLAVFNALFASGAAAPIQWRGLLMFAAGAIGIIIVIAIIDRCLSFAAGLMGAAAPLVEIVAMVIFGLALIALLVLTDRTLLNGTVTGELGHAIFLDTPRIAR